MVLIHVARGADLVRLYGLSSATSDGLCCPREGAHVLRDIGQSLAGVPLVLKQVQSWLTAAASGGEVVIRHGAYAAHAEDAVGVVLAYLTAVEGVLDQAVTGLRAAQIIADTFEGRGQASAEACCYLGPQM